MDNNIWLFVQKSLTQTYLNYCCWAGSVSNCYIRCWQELQSLGKIYKFLILSLVDPCWPLYTFLITKEWLCNASDFWSFLIIIYRIYLEEWLEDKTKFDPKSTAESVKYRLEGNKIYQIGKDGDALKIYNSSVKAAPFNTNEFALALANRSAVLMRLNYFKVSSLLR